MPVRPIAVSGYGLTTALGVGKDVNWRAISAGEAGLRQIRRFEVGDYPVRLGGEAPAPGAAAPFLAESSSGIAGPWSEGDACSECTGDSSASGPVETEQLRRVVQEAFAQARLESTRAARSSRLALVVGSSLAGSSTADAFFADYASRGASAADYRLLEGYYVDNQLNSIAAAVGVDTAAVLVSNACAAGGSSVSTAARWLQLGRADVVVALGFDPLSVFTFAGFGSLKALSTTAMRPFSKNRDGMLLGDGYAAIVLERLEDALARGGEPAALLVGYGESTDAHHLTQPHPHGAGAAAAMRSALEGAELSPQAIDYINCHGTGTRANDSAEVAAMRQVFGDRLVALPVSSSKPFFGHTLGAAGTVEAAVTLMSLQQQTLPPTLDVDELDPGFSDLDVVPDSRPALLRYAMSNSFGFGGSNVSLVFGRWSGNAQELAARPGSQGPQRATAHGARRTETPPRALAVVEGVGVVSPWGLGVEALRRGLLSGKPFLSETRASARGVPVPRRAAVLGSVLDAAREMLAARSLRRVAPISLAAVAAAHLAYEQVEAGDFLPSRGSALDEHTRNRTAVLLGTVFGAAQYHFDYYESLYLGGLRDASPLLFSESVMNAAPGHVALHFGLHGPSLAMVGGEDVGLLALGDALDRLRLGEIDAALAGGAEEYCDFVHAGLAQQGLVSAEPGTPFGTIRPLFGEGAALLFLSRGAAAPAGARRKGCVLGWGAARRRADEHVRECVERATRTALDDAEVAAADIDLVVLSAAGGPHDVAELEGVGDVLADGRQRHVLAPKEIIGEGFACASVLQAVAAILALESGNLSARMRHVTFDGDVPKFSESPRAADGNFLRYSLVSSVNRSGAAVVLVLGVVNC